MVMRVITLAWLRKSCRKRTPTMIEPPALTASHTDASLKKSDTLKSPFCARHHVDIMEAVNIQLDASHTNVIP